MENQMELADFSLSKQKLVVIVENGCKNYGSKKNSVCVLQNLNMMVPQGAIYGLLGSSGCGKTTLLKCILGQRELDSGSIWILGGPPNSKESKVPGPSIGYMPQSVGVQPEFTTRETMQYFGKIAGMSTKNIKERIEFLQRLLMLPDLDLACGNLSGGEKRRVSFAIALIHEPELLILDEPTVGLDPLLRDSIWNYLHQITSKNQVTVILTTHYIDETRNANIVSLLRGGTLLAEESPDNLLVRWGASTLEEVFLHLSIQQSDNDASKQSTEVSNILSSIYEKQSTNITPAPKINHTSHLKTLVEKNLRWMLKNPMLLLFAIVIPAAQIFLFHIAVGHDPTDLNIAVFNEETSMQNCSPISCDSSHLSCNYLQYLEKAKLKLIPYDSEDSAIQSVRSGKNYASVYFKHNYTSALKECIKYKVCDDWNVRYENIEVYSDFSSYQINLFFKYTLFKNFDTFLHDYLKSCRSRRKLSSPLTFGEPVFGKSLPDFGQFALPAIILSSVCFFSSWSTASALLTEFGNGVTERSLVLGLNPLFLLFAHAVSEFIILILHIVTVFISIFVILKFPLEGSLTIAILVMLLQGICGMCFGFVLYSICTSDVLASYIILGSFFPASCLSGIIWPIEGMPIVMQYIGFVMPFSQSAEALRSVMQRGWGITYYSIYTCFCVLAVWVAVLLTISILSVKYIKR